MTANWRRLTDQPRISAEDMLNMAFSMMSARQKQKFKETTEIDMAYGVAGLGRFRVNIFQQRGNVGLVLRVIPTKIRALGRIVPAQSGGADLRHASRAGAGHRRHRFR